MRSKGFVQELEAKEGRNHFAPDQQEKEAGQRTPMPVAIPTAARTLAELPVESTANSLRQSALLQMQHTHGNAFVARALAPQVQRQEGGRIPASEGTETEPLAEGTEGTGPTELASGGSVVRVTPGGVEVSGGIVDVNAGLSRFNGVVQADTLITNSVVSSSYTPGAGNIW